MNILKVTVFAAVVSYSSHLPLLASEGADATVNLVIQELIEDVPDIRELLADKENAPESTMVFGSDKTDIQEDLDEQLDRIIKVLVGSDYEAATSMTSPLSGSSMLTTTLLKDMHDGPL